MLAAFVVSVEQEGATPDKSAQVGCEACGAPDVEMLSSQLCTTGAKLSTPPRTDGAGAGRSAPTIARGAMAPDEPLGVARNRLAP
jgi:hypothetical protein